MSGIRSVLEFQCHTQSQHTSSWKCDITLPKVSEEHVKTFRRLSQMVFCISWNHLWKSILLMKFSVFHRSPFFFRCMKVYIKINAHFFFAKFMLETEIVQKLSLCAYKVLVRTYSTQIFKENENICKILEVTMMTSWHHKPYDVNSAFQPGSNLTEMWGFF